jgi:hypothetical protein
VLMLAAVAGIAVWGVLRAKRNKRPPSE